MLENESDWNKRPLVVTRSGGSRFPMPSWAEFAVCLHGYRRNTVDVDVLVRRDDSDTVLCDGLNVGVYWDAKENEFNSPSGIAIQFLLTGDRAGPDSEVRLPDPSDERNVTEVEGLPVLRLSRLIETEIVCPA